MVTNRVGAGAYRAPGAPPAAFAMETLLDRLAAELGPRPGGAAPEQRAAWPATRASTALEIKSLGARECLEARARRTRCGSAAASCPRTRASALSIGWWPGGLEPAAAICRLDSDGKLTVVSAAADMSGIDNAFATIAAETFGLAEDACG